MNGPYKYFRDLKPPANTDNRIYTVFYFYLKQILHSIKIKINRKCFTAEDYITFGKCVK